MLRLVTPVLPIVLVALYLIDSNLMHFIRNVCIYLVIGVVINVTMSSAPLLSPAGVSTWTMWPLVLIIGD